MELAGLEPATSWVRYRPAPRSNDAVLQGVSVLISPEPVTSFCSFPGGFEWIWAQIPVPVASGRSTSGPGHACT